MNNNEKTNRKDKTMTDEERLGELQEELFNIDKQIVLLLNQRADFSTELNTLKLKLDMPLNDKLEEYDIMEALEKISAYTNMINDIYPAIFKYSKTLYEE
jgi:chorismate mutase